MKKLTTINVRFVILKKLEEYIYRPVTDRMNSTLDSIIQRNDGFSNSDHQIFWYRGERWHTRVFGVWPQGIPRLHEELHAAMDAYITERNHILNVEGPLITGFLRCILNHSKDALEMLALIPVSLQEPVKDLLTANLGELPTKTTDEVAELVKAPQNATEALKLRLMRNLLEG